MNDDVQYFTQKSGLKTAYRWTQGQNPAQPTILFLPGYMSDMDGGKAQAIFAHAQHNDRGCLLLDYSGCGQSEGAFADGCLSLWRDEICALMDDKISGPVILIGSSMGGWLMLMVAKQLIEKQGAGKLQAMIGIAAAPDFTDWDYDAADKAIIAREGVLYRDNDYGYDPTPIYDKFYQDGQDNLFLPHEIAIDCPVTLFHGQNDGDVPFEISMQLAKALRSSHVHINLIKDADHRFSRDNDIAMLVAAVEQIWTEEND